MAPEVSSRRVAAWFLTFFLASLAASPAQALRILNYNLNNYPQTSNVSTKSGVRHPMFRTIITPLDPDVIVLQEVLSQAGVDGFQTGVLDSILPGTWTAAPFQNGNDTDNACFYKPSRVTLLDTQYFYPSATNLRLVGRYHFRLAGYTSPSAEFWIYSQHLKASTGSTNETQRLNEAIGIRNDMNNLPAGAHAIVAGDFNIYGGSEAAFLKFKESQADNDGQLYDPLNAPTTTWNTASLSAIHTQCPCATCPTSSGYSGGGLDDRFDMFLPTYPFADGEGLELLTATYKPVGNDGQHYNLNISDAPTIPEGAAYANALWGGSDHLPVRVDLSVPAKVSASTSPIALGTVIQGALPSQNLLVTNGAAAPADTLEYTYAPPAGFSAPLGVQTRLAGASASDAIALATGVAGNYAGNLALNSNDLDTPSLLIPVSATVLRHASSSADSLVFSASGGPLDFGDHEAGAFGTALARVHNLGYDALQARLAVTGFSIVGPAAARFAVAGFAPALVAGAAGSWSVTFDDTGAPADSTYQATLTFTTTDEALPGSAPQHSIGFGLSARITSGTVAVGDVRPGVTRLYTPTPNPLPGAGTVRFDLARAANVALEVFDLSGRRVATLARGTFEAGVHSRRWDARHDDGRPAEAGLYFIRMSGAGIPTQTVRAALVR